VLQLLLLYRCSCSEMPCWTVEVEELLVYQQPDPCWVFGDKHWALAYCSERPNVVGYTSVLRCMLHVACAARVPLLLMHTNCLLQVC
jgi:hypothetical protein